LSAENGLSGSILPNMPIFTRFNNFKLPITDT
jgi:hypothetical protein